MLVAGCQSPTARLGMHTSWVGQIRFWCPLGGLVSTTNLAVYFAAYGMCTICCHQDAILLEESPIPLNACAVTDDLLAITNSTQLIKQHMFALLLPSEA